MTEDALAGLTVLEYPDSVAIRYCGKLLLAHGARVIQAAEPSPVGVGYGGAASEAFAAWLDHGKARHAASAAGRADLVIAGDTVAGAASGALHLALTWFDPRGPYRDWHGTDALIQALSGVAFAVGATEGPPLLPRGHAPQLIAGATACIAALAGLIGRGNGWRGEQIAVDVLSANLCFMESQVAMLALTGDTALRRGLNRFSTYPGGIYPAADGWIGVTALTPAQWTAFCDMVGLPELGRDRRYQVLTNRLADSAALEPQLADALARRPAAHWLEEGQRRRIPMAPVPDLADLVRTPHWRERGSFAPVGGVAEATGPAMPFHFHRLGAERFHRLGAEPWHGRSPATQPALPLQGINVLDLSMGWAGPLAARHFADLGADVLKVESCGYFDWWRGWDGDMNADPPPYETRPSFLMVNRNKRGITLDFKTDDGRALLSRLAAQADVLIENHAPGVLDKLGVGAAALAEANPGLIALSMGAFGARGPWRGFRAYGSTVEQASGLPCVNGRAGDAPTMQHVAYGDPVAGIYGAIACLVALYAGRRRRISTWIDLGQVECLFQLGADAIIAQSLRADALPRQGSAHPASLLRLCVPAAGADEWLAVSVETDEQLRVLCRWLDEAAPDRIEIALADWSSGRPASDAASVLQSSGVPAAIVRPAHQLPDDPQLREAGFWQWLERPFIGRHLVPAAPYRLDGAPPPLARPAPTLGQHNQEVLGERLGLGAAELERLERTYVIGTRAAVRAD
ncbi:MAG TPA: CoA transferase [Acetobacteraceae bacterium]|nr:CoA transferase [Acetobacteraceae bacterium]